MNNQPSSQYCQAGSNAVFNIAARGTGTLAYQWFKDGGRLVDGGRISGATTSQLSVNGLIESDAGNYRVRVTDDCGSVMSLSAILTLNPDLQIFSADNSFSIVWSDPTARLQQADSPAGPWVDLPGGSSSFFPSTAGLSKFFRIVVARP